MKNIKSGLKITILIVCNINCRTTVTREMKSTFRFINQTPQDIRIQGWYLGKMKQDFTVPQTSQTDIETVQDKVAMNPDEFFGSDSIELTLENNKKLIYSWYRKSPTSQYIGNGLGYTEEIISSEHTRFTYLLTQEHIDSAQ